MDRTGKPLEHTEQLIDIFIRAYNNTDAIEKKNHGKCAKCGICSRCGFAGYELMREMYRRGIVTEQESQERLAI